MDPTNGTSRPDSSADGHAPPRDSADHLERRRAQLDVLASAGTRPWPWWAKVRAHIESNGETVTDLANRAGLPRRSLHRWLYEVTDDEMFDRGPPGEVGIVVRLAEAIGLSPYALLHPAIPWPIPDGVVRFGTALRDLFDATALIGAERRTAIVSTTFSSFADTADVVRTTVEGSEGRRRGLRARVEAILAEKGEGSEQEA